MVVFRDSALVVKDTMFSRYRNRGSRNVGRYKARWVEYCDDALTMLQRQRFDLVLVLSVHMPWTLWPTRGYSPQWRADLTNGILFLKHLRTLQSPPPVILLSGSPLAEAEGEALASGAFAFVRNRSSWPKLTGS